MRVIAPLLLVLALAAPATAEAGKEALAKARQALKKRNYALARTEVRGALSVDDPGVRARGHQLSADIEVADKKPEKALSHWRDAVALLDESGARAGVRSRAIGKWARCAKKAKDDDTKETIAALKKADRLLAPIERWPLLPAAGAVLRPPLEELEAAAKVYVETRQKLRAARLKAGLAIAYGAAGRKEALEQAREAVRLCPAPWKPDDAVAKRCKLTTLRSSARARILLARSQAAGNGLDKALKDSLDADVLESGEGAGLYRRTATTVALCDAVDAIAGPGSCRRHEIDLAGKLSFFDYSRRPPSPVLTEQSVERTHAEYAFLLNRCLIEGARADPYLRGMQVELEWVVQPSGTVDDIKVDPRRFREHPTASCLQSALKVFRYPPYRSRERRWLTLALQVGN